MSPPASPQPERRPGALVGRVRVLVYASAPGDAPEAVETAYHTVSRALEGTPGLIGNALLRSVHEPGAFVVMSEWTDLESFRAWEKGAEHRELTAPLRPLQDDRGRGPFGIYEITAAY
ncbi:antibiotic biosynthesis monooxygenase [Actinomadura rubrobrunea]|uniref:Antibiotic biosynthesis monooxygenase n=1 Tax=Actinomadura rubrobrunea TaxID=115335 RepID=A0A9W6PT18_9ACTN|nr:antibiotic biosynthesis monooxygenase family protein [Actinomadura rubrobrunea]GLW63955.1 antibiotic biosynthesis monooxygenase [Actinomadura rubrobrunea]